MVKSKQKEVLERPELSSRKSEGFRTPYNGSYRVATYNDEPSLTKQSFKDECDINNIMDKFTKTGVLNHLAKHKGVYGQATPVDLMDAITLVREAQESFDSLPASLRKKFSGNPAEFLAWAQDPSNEAEMAEYGLLGPQTQEEYEKAAKVAAEAAEAVKSVPAEPSAGES